MKVTITTIFRFDDADSRLPNQHMRIIYLDGKAIQDLFSETYITFIIEHSDSAKISPVFENLKHSLDDMNILRATTVIGFTEKNIRDNYEVIAALEDGIYHLTVWHWQIQGRIYSRTD